VERVKDCKFSSLIQMTRRIITSVRDMIQLGLDKCSVMESQFSGSTLPLVVSMTQDLAESLSYVHIHVHVWT
jgi:hypothetical protein